MSEERSTIDQSAHTLKPRSLLTKYEIPIDHLSYEYIGTCKNIKELERIVKILKSGEEGYFSDLQTTAEDRLCTLSPNNRHLRKDGMVLTHKSMNKDDWNNVISDISNWKKEISSCDLKLAQEHSNIVEETTPLTIRQSVSPHCLKNKLSENTTSVKYATDYSAWDKYDVDTEILKMDLEQERKKEEQEYKQEEKKIDRLQTVIEQSKKLSETERQCLAEQEKNRGNEYYQIQEYTDAIKYYSASIAIWPTPKAYNNRAACYLKQHNYSAVVEDANNTLGMEPNNIKALFRRGVALQHKHMFQESLEDLTTVLKQQPNHVKAQQVLKEVKKQTLSISRDSNIIAEEKLNTGNLKGVAETNIIQHVKDSVSSQCHEKGFPSTSLQDNKSPILISLIQQISSTSDLQTHSQPNLKNVKISEHYNQPKSSTKMKIIEVEKLETGEKSYSQKKSVIVDKRCQDNVLK